LGFSIDLRRSYNTLALALRYRASVWSYTIFELFGVE